MQGNRGSAMQGNRVAVVKSTGIGVKSAEKLSRDDTVNRFQGYRVASNCKGVAVWIVVARVRFAGALGRGVKRWGGSFLMGGHRLASCKHSPKGESVMQPNPLPGELGCERLKVYSQLVRNPTCSSSGYQPIQRAVEPTRGYLFPGLVRLAVPF